MEAIHHAIVFDPFTETFIRVKAYQLARSPRFTLSEVEDLQQSMRLYLLKKAHLLDLARGNVEAFVTQTLNTWVGMELRYRKRDKRRFFYDCVMSLERTKVECEGDVTILARVLLKEDGNRLGQIDPITPLEHLELKDAVDHVMANLTPEDQTLLASVAEIGSEATAEATGISWRQIAKVLVRTRLEFVRAGLGPK